MAISSSRPRRQNWDSNDQYQELIRLYDLVNRLQDEITALKVGQSGASNPAVQRGLQSSVAIPAIADPQASAQVYPTGFNPSVNISSVSGGSTGYTFTVSNGIATMSVSSAATVRSSIGAAQSSGIGAGTATLAKLNPAGANGSISWNADGCITAYTAPT
mgnify:CR=1 FL=1